MLILRIPHYDQNIPLYASLWEENMHEPWSDYDGADRFIIVDGGDVVGGFAIYWDESDGVAGNFMSGWVARHRKVPVLEIIRRAADIAGELYFKTDQRTAKIILHKIGKIVKNEGSFGYFIVRGQDNGKA